MLRHFFAEMSGEATDAESGFLHAAHCAWNALARLDLIIRRLRAEDSVSYAALKAEALASVHVECSA